MGGVSATGIRLGAGGSGVYPAASNYGIVGQKCPKGDGDVELTPKRKRFVEEYAIDQNATQAAIRAGYPSKSARTQGSDLLALPYISKAVAAKLAQLTEKTDNTYAELVEWAQTLRERSFLAKDYRSALQANAELAKLGGHYPSDKLKVEGDLKVSMSPATAATIANYWQKKKVAE